MKMLVKYKNLISNKITEENDLFIGQLHEKFQDMDKRFIRAVVNCIKDAIFEENALGIVKEGGRVQANVESNIMSFFSELKKFSRDVTYSPVIKLDLRSGFCGINLKFLLELPQKYLIEDSTRFKRHYSTTIPEVSPERMCESVEFIFDAMREATERGLKGEECQTEKLRVAEETWEKSYLGLIVA